MTTENTMSNLETWVRQLSGELNVEQAERAIASSSDANERAAKRAANRQAEAVAAMPDEVLADELVRRGWVCIPGE